MKHRIGIVGATGLVGRTMIQVLQESKIEVQKMVYFASKKSAGKTLQWNDDEITVCELNSENIKNHPCDFILMSAGSEISREYAPQWVEQGSIVIDNSNFWRMNKTVPLVVPEVNAHTIKQHNGIIANPNCSTIQAVVALAPLHKKYKIKRVVYSTYQAVSGAGIAGLNALESALSIQTMQQNNDCDEVFGHPIGNNIIPQIDDFLDNGYTKEEMKLIEESKKILDNPGLKITATAVRVPIANCHSESIAVEFCNQFDWNDALLTLQYSDGVVLQNDDKNQIYPMPILATGKNKVFVGRVRRDISVPNGLHLWVVADNIRKGAATNAVQILEKLISQ